MKITTVIFIILNLKTFCYSQIHKVFRNDTFLVFADNKNYSRPEFAEKLYNGTWIVYNLERKDSAKKNADDFIRAIGQYKDSLRDGIFKYFYRCNQGKKVRKIEIATYNFKNGKLDGQYISRNCGGKIYDEGFYIKGKKVGFFITYFKSEQIKAIGLYKNDTLCEWSNYYKNGFIESKGKGEGKFTNGEVIQYDSLSNLTRKEFYQNGKLLWYKEFYSDGIIKKESSGEFNICYTLSDITEKDKCLNIPVKGIIIYYTRKGDIEKKETY